MKEEEKRKDVLTLIMAAMSISAQLSDRDLIMRLSEEIIQDASDKYGRTFVEDVLSEIVTAELVQDTDTIPKDILINRARLSLVRPLPASWMQTRN